MEPRHKNPRLTEVMEQLHHFKTITIQAILTGTDLNSPSTRGPVKKIFKHTSPCPKLGMKMDTNGQVKDDD